jgi:hypothetical protein
MTLAYTQVLTDGAVAQLEAPTAITATANTTAVQINPAHADAALVLNNGAITGAPTSVAAQLQCSADGSTNWTNVVGAALSITAAGTQMAAFRPQDQVGWYYRIAYTVTGGSSPSVTCAADLVYLPVVHD